MVQLCIKRLRALHSDVDIKILDERSAGRYFDEIPVSGEIISRLSLPHRSDLLRTFLLVEHGGIWCDPTVFVLNRFENWLYPRMKNGLFVFTKPGPDRVISNWFLAAERKNKILQAFFNRLCTYWRDNEYLLELDQFTPLRKLLNRAINRRPFLTRFWLTPFCTRVLRSYPYMIYHYLFNQMLAGNSNLAKEFKQLPNLPASPALRFSQKKVLRSLSMDDKRYFHKPDSPVLKLDWSVGRISDSKGSVLEYLESLA